MNSTLIAILGITLVLIYAITSVPNVMFILKIVIAVLSLIFSLLVLRNLVGLQDNYKSRLYPVFLGILGFLILVSLSFLFQFFYK